MQKIKHPSMQQLCTDINVSIDVSIDRELQKWRKPGPDGI